MRILFTGLFAAAVLALTSCSGSGRVSVSGVVTLDGEPVPEASVSFVPDDPAGEVATGYTDEDGKFTLSGPTGTSGAKPGKYKVRIEAVAERPPATKGISQVLAEKYAGKEHGASSKDINKEANAALAQQRKEGGTVKNKRFTTPAVYADIAKTPLQAEVPSKGDYKFELHKDAK